MIVRRTLLACVAGFCAAAALSLPAAAAWPEKPVRIVVPYPPGGSTDIVGRLVGAKLSEALGQQFIVENRPGAGGNLGMELAAKAAPDGYTIVVATTAHAINMTLFKNLTFDTVKDFEPVALLTENPLIVVTHPSVPANSIRELIALAKAKPGGLNYASSGNGQSTHLAAELFNAMAGTKMAHIPYKGSAPGIADVMAGQVQLMFDTMLSALPHARSGALRALAVTSAERSPAASDIPTVSESGLPGYEAIAWNGFLVPKGTPADIVAKLNAETVKALAAEQVKTRLDALGATTKPTTPAEFAAYVGNEVDKWGKVVKTSGATID